MRRTVCISFNVKYMQPTQTTTVGVFKDKDHAEMAIGELRTLGVPDSDLSYVYTSPEGKMVQEDSTGKNVADGVVSGMTTGGIIGAIAGLVVANGILPGLGSLFVAGPLAAGLGLTGAAATTAAGAMTGAAAGGLVGALGGLGVSASDAKLYEQKVKEGGILVTVKSALATGVRNVFAKHGADEIREYNMKMA